MALFGRKKQAGESDADADGVRKKGLFGRLVSGLASTREKIVGGLVNVLTGRGRIDEDLLEEIEEALLVSDMGSATVDQLVVELTRAWKAREIEDADEVLPHLQRTIAAALTERGNEIEWAPDGPTVILIVGVNGTGKTTTIGRLAWRFKNEGKRVLIAAGDTFRAAAENQLRIWAEERVGVDFIQAEISSTSVDADKQQDPAAVAHRACERARAEGHDVVLFDTAGRLHTQKNLMQQLEKIKRVLGKQIPGAPHEVLLVLDATTGQNAVTQAQLFKDAAGVTGLCLAKLDSTAKGGVVLAIHTEVDIPVKFIGLGEQKEDLAPFDAGSFVEALFSTDDTAGTR